MILIIQTGMSFPLTHDAGSDIFVQDQLRGNMINAVIIGIGGFFGAIARYGVGLWIGQRWGRSFPLGTFVINVSGSFVIGLAMSLLTERLIVNPQWRLLLVVGFLGAYTTFSTFEYETGALLKDGEWFFACMNVVLSVLAGFIALKAGEVLAKSI
jgi:CrcB protein